MAPNVLRRDGMAALLRHPIGLRSRAPLYSVRSVATRKPRPLNRLPGESLPRYAGRQCVGPSLQFPPRTTRDDAPEGPGGSARGDIA